MGQTEAGTWRLRTEDSGRVWLSRCGRAAAIPVLRGQLAAEVVLISEQLCHLAEGAQLRGQASPQVVVLEAQHRELRQLAARGRGAESREHRQHTGREYGYTCMGTAFECGSNDSYECGICNNRNESWVFSSAVTRQCECLLLGIGAAINGPGQAPGRGWGPRA